MTTRAEKAQQRYRNTQDRVVHTSEIIFNADGSDPESISIVDPDSIEINTGDGIKGANYRDDGIIYAGGNVTEDSRRINLVNRERAGRNDRVSVVSGFPYNGRRRIGIDGVIDWINSAEYPAVRITEVALGVGVAAGAVTVGTVEMITLGGQALNLVGEGINSIANGFRQGLVVPNLIGGYTRGLVTSGKLVVDVGIGIAKALGAEMNYLPVTVGETFGAAVSATTTGLAVKGILKLKKKGEKK